MKNGKTTYILAHPTAPKLIWVSNRTGDARTWEWRVLIGVSPRKFACGYAKTKKAAINDASKAEGCEL